MTPELMEHLAPNIFADNIYAGPKCLNEDSGSRLQHQCAVVAKQFFHTLDPALPTTVSRAVQTDGKKDSVDGSRMIQNENLVNWDTLAQRKREITKCLVKTDSFFSFQLGICARSLDPSGTTVQTRQHPDFHVAVSARNRPSES